MFSVISGGNRPSGATLRFAVQFDEATTKPVTRFKPASVEQISDVPLRRSATLGDLHLREAGRHQIGNDLFEVHVDQYIAHAVECNSGMPPLYSEGSKMTRADERMSMGERLRGARTARKLSQMRLAAMAGVSQSTISDIERGRNAGSTEAAKLAAVLGVSALWLSTGRGSRTDDAPIRPVMPQRQINTALLIQCMRAATAFQAQTGSQLDDEDLLRLACRLYEQHYDAPNKTAQELLGYLITLNELLDLSQNDRDR